MKKSNFRERGFTLVEMIFVLAIILTLVAIFLPLATSKLSDANTTRAKADEDALSAAMTAFFSDLSIWPASNNTGTGTGNTNNQKLHYLLVGDGGATITSSNPSIASATWSGNSQACPTGDSTIAGVVASGSVPAAGCNNIQNAFNHLAINDPTKDGAANSNQDYKSSGNKKWKGPYVAKLASDPFGNNYVINIGAITGKGTTGSTELGWILSAGADGSLQTASTDTSTSSDDIGYIFCTNCQ